MATATKDLAVTPAAPPAYAIMALEPHELAEALLANTDGQALSPWDLDQVKIPPAGMTTWVVPSLEGDQETKSLEGIVILQSTRRSYWAAGLEESGGGSPPDCSSQDGVMGVGSPGGVCADCPLAQFGSAKGGRGQACKTNRLLFLLRPDSVLPLVVKVPPSSLRPVKQFMLRLSGQGIFFYGAVISLSLKKVSNAANIAYGEVVPSLVRRLSPDETVRMRAIHESLKPVLARVRVDADA